MGLFTSLQISANSMSVFSRGLSVLENNVANASTPGYVKQDLLLVALPFDISRGIPGGVAVGGLLNRRSEFLEQAVRNQNEQLGAQSQEASDLGI